MKIILFVLCYHLVLIGITVGGSTVGFISGLIYVTVFKNNESKDIQEV